MTKIIHLITGLSTGGAEMSLYRLLKNMDTSRFTNLIVSMTSGGEVRKLIERDNIEVVDLGMKRGSVNLAGLIRLVKIISANRPDILQTWLYHADLLGLVASKLSASVSLVWNIRCARMDRDDCSKTLSIIIWLLARFSSAPRAVIVNSLAGKMEHEKMGYTPGRWELIHNGVDTKMYGSNPSAKEKFCGKMGLPHETILVGHVARFHPMKDHDTFIKSATLVLANYPMARFIMVGNGVDETNDELKKLIEKLGMESKIYLLGERGDLTDIIPALDISVSSSAYGEGFSNSTMEAMACAVPCVVTDVGDSAMIVDETGKVVPPRDPQALATACEELLSMSDDERRNLGRKARERIENNFTIDVATNKYTAFYETLAKAE